MHIIREISKGKLEVGIIKGSILVKFLMCSGMCSKVVLRLAGAILDAFCINMGLICRKTAQNEIFEKCAKIGSVFRIIPILIQYRRKLGNYMSSIRQIPTTKCSG